MFGKNRKKTARASATPALPSDFAEKSIRDSSDLYEVLIADYSANRDVANQNYTFRVAWKSDDKAQTVICSYAPVPSLGDIAYFSAPIVDAPTEKVLRRIFAATANLLDGDLVMLDSLLVLRIALPLGSITGAQLHERLQHFAAGAQALRDEFEDEVQTPTLTFGY